MKLIGFCLFAMSGLAWSAEASAAVASTEETSRSGPRHEVLLGLAVGEMSFGDSALSTSLGAGWNYSVSPRWQVGFFPTLAAGYASGNIGLSYNLGLFVGPTFNLSDDFTSSFYLRTALGVRHVGLPSQGYSETAFGVQAHFGKRFALTEHILYTPSIGLEKSFLANSPTRFSVNVLSFSVAF